MKKFFKDYFLFFLFVLYFILFTYLMGKDVIGTADRTATIASAISGLILAGIAYFATKLFYYLWTYIDKDVKLREPRKKKDKKKIASIFMTMVLFIALSQALWAAGDILPSRTIVTTNNVVVRNDNLTESARPKVYNLNRWKVEENTDPVNRALGVYKKRSESKYNKRVWITDKNNGQKRMIVQYTPRDVDDKIVFSSDENYMYYLGVTPAGTSIVYGINLLSNQEFSVASGQNFNVLNCPDKTTYIVVEDGQTKAYQVFSMTGERMQTLTNTQPIDIEKSLCR